MILLNIKIKIFDIGMIMEYNYYESKIKRREN